MWIKKPIQCSISDWLVLVIFWIIGFQEFVFIRLQLSRLTVIICFLVCIQSSIYLSLIFLSLLQFTDNVFGCKQLKLLCHVFVCSVVPDDCHLPLMYSCWWSIDLISFFFLFVCSSTCTIYLIYARDYCLMIILHKMVFKFFTNVKPFFVRCRMKTTQIFYRLVTYRFQSNHIIDDVFFHVVL